MPYLKDVNANVIELFIFSTIIANWDLHLAIKKHRKVHFNLYIICHKKYIHFILFDLLIAFEWWHARRLLISFDVQIEEFVQTNENGLIYHWIWQYWNAIEYKNHEINSIFGEKKRFSCIMLVGRILFIERIFKQFQRIQYSCKMFFSLLSNKYSPLKRILNF